MILADKIITLRKKEGWSQEELAERLEVSRQAVSKWESAQSIPDIDKILKMSRLFGVSTDYLLRDDLETAEYTDQPEESTIRRISLEEASDYLAGKRRYAPFKALATLLCILSPILLMLLAALSDSQPALISENAAAAIGIAALLLFVAAGVTIFLICGDRMKEYDFLEKEPFESAYGVSGMVREAQQSFRETYLRANIFGTVLCILSVIPLVTAACTDNEFLAVTGVCLLLLLVGLGSFAFVWGGEQNAAMDRLLQQGDYTPQNRERASRSAVGAISGIYWLLVTALFLLCTFSEWMSYKQSWIIWAVGGVLYAALVMLIRLIERRNGDR